MAKGMLVEAISQGFIESHDEIRPKSAKISFSHKLKIDSTLPAHSGTSGTSPIDGINGVLGKTEMFFARIGGFPEDGMRWIAENINNNKVNVKLPWDLGGALNGTTQRVSVPRKKEMRRLGFARVADTLDPDTREKLEEVKEDTEEKLEEVKEDVVETAQQSRVSVPSTTLPYIGFIHSLAIKDLLCGVLAGAVASTIAVPFDVVRTRVIAGQGGRTAAQVVTTVAREEGLQTLMKGSLKFNVVRNGVEKGLQFAAFEYVKRNQERTKGHQEKVLPLPRQIPLATAGGAAGGLVGTLLGYPVMPLYDRLLLQPEKYKSLQGALKEILRNEGGVRELYRGITPALIAVVPNAAVTFYAYETLKTKYLPKAKLRPELQALRSLVLGGLAGAIATTVTYPLELARKEILLSALSSKAVQFAEGHVRYNNTWQALNGIAKSQGLRGLYRGLTAQNLQIVPMSAVTFMVYELAKRTFVASGEESRDEVKDADDLD